MPTPSARAQAAAALEQAFMMDWISDLEFQKLDYDDDWDSSDSDSDSSSSSSSSSDASASASSVDLSDDELTAAQRYMRNMETLYARRYLQQREKIAKSSDLLHILLSEYKVNRPEIFRSYVRMTPACFDDLVDVLKDDPVFHNRSNNRQMPVEHQLAITLYRFGHHGNAASNMKVGLLFGVGYGTVNLVTSRVIKAVCAERFRTAALQWPDAAEQEKAKQWVEDASCPGWRDGWLMVDGTLVPLFRRPAHFGNTFYDRKSNYSLNVQLVSTPDCMIIDYSIGLPGSQHDATAWEQTRIANQHEDLLEEGQFVWADTAYPLRIWCQSPYKKPEKELEENAKYNYHVSRVRVRSEHCVGFLKCRWCSLKGLRVAVDTTKGLMYASLWVTACIHLHCFALRHENSNRDTLDNDRFFREGRKYAKKVRQSERRWRREQRSVNARTEQELDEDDDLELLEGKYKRAQLKEILFDYIGR